MCAVGTAEGVAGLTGQFGFNGGEIARRQNHVGVKDEDVVARGALHTVIARWPGAGVGFGKIVEIEFVGIAFGHIGTWQGRTVFHDNHLKVFKRLRREAFEQFAGLVGSVKHRNNDGIFHLFSPCLR